MKTATGNKNLIKTIADVDVDGLRGVNYYTIKEMWDVEYADGDFTWCEIEYKVVDEFDYPWSDIERDGGLAQVQADLRECYGVEN